MKIWILRILLVVFFFISGSSKLTNSPEIVANFNSWGMDLWIMYLVGVLEIAFGLGLLLKKFASRSAFLLSTLMIGATIVHYNFNDNILPPLLLAILCFYVSVKTKQKPAPKE